MKEDVSIQNAIDQFFFGRYASWKRTEDGVKIQWLPDGSENNWIPVKDWKDTPYTMACGQLQDFAKFFLALGCRRAAEMYDEIGYGKRQEEDNPVTAEPKKEIAPYVPRKHRKGASSLGYVELSSIASHYKIGINVLKEILTQNSIPWGTILKDSTIRSTHSLVAVKYINDVHHAVINSI